MQNAPHTVVEVDDSNTALRQAALLNQFRKGMRVVAWCQNPSDAEIVRSTYETINNKKDGGRSYYVLTDNK